MRKSTSATNACVYTAAGQVNTNYFYKFIMPFLALLFIGQFAMSQVSLTSTGSGNAYNQNFNTNPAAVPAGWAFNEAGGDASFATGAGGANAGNTYFFGLSNEWAFGGLQSGSLNPTIGAAFTNSTGATITELVINYKGETWRVGTASRSDRLDFQYSLNATSLTTGTWVNFDALDYANPGQAATGSGSQQHSANISATISSLNIAAGATIWIRWTDFNASGADDGMAIDDFSIYATPPPVVTYTVLYDGNTNTSGTAPVDGSSPYISGSTVTVLGVGSLAKTGYSFTGWNTAANGSGTPYVASNTFSITANTTLYAQWQINSYTVVYNGNGNDGGTVPSDGSSPYTHGSNVTILGPGSMTRAGYNFAGWATQADGGGTQYAANDLITGIAASITLYAKWQLENSYYITYLGNDNTGGTAPIDGSSPYVGGSNVTVLGAGTLVKTGHTFTGWNTADNGLGTAYAEGATINNISASITLYAQWAINEYNVTYNGNTNTSGDAPIDGGNPHNYNTNVPVLGPGTLTKTNYNFTGWNTAADGSGTAYAEASTINGIAADITLYAQWALITYTVGYDGNTNTGGTAPVDGSSPYASGTNVTVLSEGTLVKTGHSFTGWNTAADGSGSSYIATNTFSIAANTTLYAQWTINSYTVTYDGNGNTGGNVPVDASSPYTYNSTVTVLANTGGLVKTGASFIGWNTAANGSGTDYAATGSATFTLGAANVVLYAKWATPLYEPFSYTVGQNVGGTASGGPVNNWFNHSGTGAVAVTAGSLTYTGLPASTGEKVRITNSISSDINRATTFPSGSTVGYYSLLVNVANGSGLNTTGDYFAGFSNNSGSAAMSTLYGRLTIKSSGTGFQLGIANNSGTGSNTTFYTTDLSFGTTYFVVVKHDFNGAGNDIASLWVNPSSLGGAEPAALVSNSSSTSSTPTTFASVFLRNTNTTPVADIDELRAGSIWADVAPSGNYTITAAVLTAGGAISPTGAVSVNAGADQTFTITPDACNDISEVIVDGSSVGAVASYTFEDVNANHTIEVYFNPSTSTTWTGTTNSNWDNIANWSSCVPDGTLDVIIAAGTPNLPVLNVNATVNSLTINDGAALSLSDKTLTINGGFTGSATATLTGSDAAILILNSSTTIVASAPIRLHQLQVNGGTVTLASEVEISGGTATVDPGEVSVLSGAQLESNGFLTIQSNSFGTARVAAGDDAGNYITGDVTVERYLPNNGFRSWRFLAVPTHSSGQTIKQAWQEGAVNPSAMQNNKPGFGALITGTGALAAAQAAGFDNVVAKASLQTWGTNAWTNITSTNSPIQSLKGYMLFVRGDRSQTINGTTTVATVLRTRGQLYQGTQAIPAFAANSFNSVGNLYASAIDFTQLPRTGGTRELFYIWDSKKQNGNSLGAYQTFSATNGFACMMEGGSYTLGVVNTKIESGQAFMVSTTTAGTISLTEGSKTTDGANLGLRPATPASLVKIDSRLLAAGGDAILDANVVVFNKKYTNAVGDEDAAKMTNPAENFGITQSGKTLAIEGRNTIEEADEIQFNLWNLQQQEYRLEFVAKNMDASLQATVEDSYLHTSTPVNMTGVTTVHFAVNANPASAASNRFKIVLARVKPMDTKESFTIAPNPVQNGLVNLQFKNQAAGNYSIRIVNAMGQAILVKTVAHAGGTATQALRLPAATGKGNYSVEIMAPGKKTSTQLLLVQ